MKCTDNNASFLLYTAKKEEIDMDPPSADGSPKATQPTVSTNRPSFSWLPVGS